MHIYATRDSVCAGDDVDAPHVLEFDIPGTPDIATVVEHTLKLGYLPSISGGRASWSVTSAIPVAVAAQQWPKPKHFQVFGGLREVDFASGTLRLHFNYHAQIDPQVVHDVLWGFRLRAV